jgi:membrane associated rhomboid family serine protease
MMKAKTPQGFFYGCPTCKGRAIGYSVLKRTIGVEYAKRLWIHAIQGVGHAGAPCPSCHAKMFAVPLKVPGSEGSLQIDVCTRCQFIWFDTAEFEKVPAGEEPAEKKPKLIAPHAKERLAMWEVERVAQKAREEDLDSDPAGEPWKWLPAIFGMPVEEHTAPVRCWPWMTWGLAVALIGVYLLTKGALRDIIDNYGLVPGDRWRHGGLTFITSFFLHGGLWHLVGNTYFLLIFGDNVEDVLGRPKYLVLLAFAAFIGALAHIAADASSTVPCIGASGGISGVITFYALRFPRARLGFLFWLYHVPKWIHMPAFAALILWLGMQFLGAYAQIAGFSNVSALAHLGGAFFGFVAWLVWRES